MHKVAGLGAHQSVAAGSIRRSARLSTTQSMLTTPSGRKRRCRIFHRGHKTHVMWWMMLRSMVRRRRQCLPWATLTRNYLIVSSFWIQKWLSQTSRADTPTRPPDLFACGTMLRTVADKPQSALISRWTTSSEHPQVSTLSNRSFSSPYSPSMMQVSQVSHPESRGQAARSSMKTPSRRLHF